VKNVSLVAAQQTLPVQRNRAEADTVQAHGLPAVILSHETQRQARCHHRHRPAVRQRQLQRFRFLLEGVEAVRYHQDRVVSHSDPHSPGFFPE
jgi:hypothetical protein